MKKNVFVTLSTMLTLVFAFSCSSENDLLDASQPNGSETDAYYVSYDAALQKATAFMASKGANKQGGMRHAKTNSTQTSEDVAVAGHQEFYAEDYLDGTTNQPKARFHLINFGYDGGFILMSADSRTTPVYAYSDEGHLDIDDAVENTGFAEFLANATEYYDKEIDDFVDGIRFPDTIKPAPDPIGDLPITVIGNGAIVHYQTVYEEEFRYGVNLPACYGQDDPYNVYCPTVPYVPTSNGRAWAGCVPVSLAEIFAFYQYPTQYPDIYNPSSMITYDWSAITSQNTYSTGTYNTGSDNLARLLHQIGKYGSIIYAVDGSSIAESSCRSLFTTFGYDCSELSTFSFDSIVSSLQNGYPVWASGYQTSNQTIGHAWVIRDVKHEVEVTKYYNWGTHDFVGQEPTGNSRTYYYCNWGWNGQYNGYFLDTFASGNGSYCYGQKIIYNIHPNN